MSELLEKLYDHFYVPAEMPELQQEIENCHRSLIGTLSKADRKILLRIIDAKDSITELRSIESFIRGFQVAWRLAAELDAYTAKHPIEGKMMCSFDSA